MIFSIALDYAEAKMRKLRTEEKFKKAFKKESNGTITVKEEPSDYTKMVKTAKKFYSRNYKTS